jgi:hypothetical protein
VARPLALTPVDLRGSRDHPHRMITSGSRQLALPAARYHAEVYVLASLIPFTPQRRHVARGRVGQDENYTPFMTPRWHARSR